MKFPSCKIPGEFLFLLIFCLPAFWVNIKNHTDWGDDYAMYLLQADNILQGKPQSENGYLYQEYAKGLGPKAYPPGFPLLLSVLLALSGLDVAFLLTAISIVAVIWLCISYFLFQKTLPPLWTAFLLMAVFYSRDFLLFKSELLSEIPYAALSFSALYVAGRYSPEKPNYRKLLLLLVLVFLSVLFRSSGWILLPMLWIHLLRNKAPLRIKSLHIAGTILVPLAYWGTSKIMGMPVGISYGDQASYITSETLWRNVSLYAQTLSSPWISFEITGPILGVIFSVILLITLIYRLIKQAEPFDYYVMGYLILLIVWPHYTLRFLIPILPLLLFYYFFAVRALLVRIRKPFVSGMVFGTALFIFIIQAIPAFADAQRYSHKTLPGPFDADARAVFDYIRKETQAQEGIAFVKPRVLAYFTQRPSLILSADFSAMENREIMKRNGVRYILLFRNGYPYQEGNEKTLEMEDIAVFENETFRLFRMNNL